MKITNLKEVSAWIGQFNLDDQADAIALLEAMVLVSADDLRDRLRALILNRVASINTPVALYAERELGSRNGVPHKLFKQVRQRFRRAFGSGPQPVKPVRAYDPDVGSEALISHLVSELCREFPSVFVNHPGPDQIRSRRVRTFMLVTDFVGSGKRVWKYLQAAWLVRSVRSWHSLKWLRFEVVAYASTDQGRKHVNNHNCRPLVSVVRQCPTINTEFPPQHANKLRQLCIQYDPTRQGSLESLGYGGEGALIAFAHSVPNNVPLVFFKASNLRSRPWTPLFPARVTSALRGSFKDEPDAAEISARLKRLRQDRLASSPWLARANSASKKNLLVLAALSRRPRFDEAIARRTGLTILEVREIVARLRAIFWIDGQLRPTEAGHRELEHARKWRARFAELPDETLEPYYPKQLRMPGTPI